MATQSPSAILRKLKKSKNTDKDGPSQKTRDDKEGDDKEGDDKHDEKAPAKGGKRNALIDFIAKNKSHSA